MKNEALRTASYRNPTFNIMVLLLWGHASPDHDVILFEDKIIRILAGAG